MSELLKNSLKGTLVVALSLAFLSTEANAQEPFEAASCTAQIDPAQVPAGEAAVRLTATLSQEVGEVTGLQTPMGSGLAVAEPEAIPRAEMANPAEEALPRPIELSADANNVVTIWLSTQDAQPGEFEVELQGAASSCTATITVAGG